MKFDINREFNLSQVFDFFKAKARALKAFIKKLDSGSIKTVTVNHSQIRINALRLGLAAAVLALCLALVINLVIVPRAAYRQYSDIEFDTGGDYEQFTCGDDVLLLNHRGIKLMNNKGEYEWEVPLTLTNPEVDIDGKYVLLSDLDGNCSLSLYNLKGENLVSYPIDTKLMSAKVNRHGKAAMAVSEEGYKGAVAVYNRKGEEIFKWNSGEGYITDVDISRDGNAIVVARVMSDGEESYSKIHVISVKNGKEIGSRVCDKSLVAKVAFDEGNRIVAVAQNKVYGLNKKCEERFVIDLAGKSPQKYDITDGDRMLFLCRDNRGGSVLEIYNKSGKLTGSFGAAEEIKNMSCHDNTIVAATSRTVMRISQRGKPKKTREVDHDILSIGVFGNRRNVLVLGGNRADIMRMR